MTQWLTGTEVSSRIRDRFPDAIRAANAVWVEVAPESLVDVCRFLRDDTALMMEQATNVTSVDWIEYYEVVYHLQSISRNLGMALKCRPPDREDPIVPSVTSVWQGAWLQEMEVYDLMGIRFAGHPNLRRLFLWEGFRGWPLRKEFLQINQGQYSPGLPHFPKQGGEYGILNGPQWTQHAGAGLAPGDQVPPEWSGAAIAWGTPPAPSQAIEASEESTNGTGG
ncbi:MAG: NADH-quinone oxidoreductase subunit C [Dehalococcoidia bacterium]